MQNQNYRVAVPTTVMPAAVTPQQAIAATQSSAASTTAAAVAGACSNRSFSNPTSVTFTAASAVGAEGCKMQSYDGAVESILGTQGTVNFSVTQLPDRATLEIGGGTLFGINVVRRRLSLFSMVIKQANYQGTTSIQLANPIVLITANIDGNQQQQNFSVDQYVNNMQQNASLITMTQPFVLHGATLMKIQKSAANEIQLTMSQITYIPYNDPAIFN